MIGRPENLVTSGVAIGPVTRLPDGVNLGDTVTDVNILKTRVTRHTATWFVSFSYSFLRSLDVLKKPFAGQ